MFELVYPHQEAIVPGIYVQRKFYGAGSILKRKGVLLPIYDHYGILLGRDNRGSLRILEKNVNGVRITDLSGFMSERKSCSIYHIPFRPKAGVLLERAASISNLPYGAFDKNCEAFVNYVIFGKHISYQAEDFKKFLSVGAIILAISSLCKRP